jgi:hypothetical protein
MHTGDDRIMSAHDVPHRVMDDVLDIDVSELATREAASFDGVPTLLDLWNDPTLEGPFRTACGSWYRNFGFYAEDSDGSRHVHLMQADEVGPTQRLTRKGHQMRIAIGPNGEFERVRS